PESLDRRRQMWGEPLASALADPLSLGEKERIKELLEKARKADVDVVYGAVVSAKGEVVAATTDSPVHGGVAAAAAEGLVRRPAPGATAVVELIHPIRLEGLGRIGTVSLGISTAHASAAATRALWMVVRVGACALVAGVVVYVGGARRVARPPN